MKEYPTEVLRKAAEAVGIPDAPRDHPFYNMGSIYRQNAKKEPEPEISTSLIAKLARKFKKRGNG